MGTWEGQEIPESELEPYLHEKAIYDSAGKPFRVTKHVHAWEPIEPVGFLRVARDAI
jgi:hypothetical protein